MQQYFIGRKKRLLKSELKNSSAVKLGDAIFANERIDDSVAISQKTINNSTFAKMGFKESTFDQCDFSFCTFVDCYFKSSKFLQVNFTSCKFINCTFDGPKLYFENCKFNYAIFENCYIPYDKMKGNFPKEEENLRIDICKNLSLQCLSLGDIVNYKKYLFEQRHAEEIHEIRKLFHKSGSYYDKKYNLWEGIGGLFNFIRSKISRFLWGYGEKISTLIRNILLVILIFSLVYLFNGDFQSNNFISQFGVALYKSVCSFFNISSYESVKSFYIVPLIESIIGIILIGFFVSALFRRINRR